MNQFFRLIFTWFIAPWRSKVDLLGPCLTPFTCFPTDLDILRHMNNGKYFSLMDLARVDLMIRAGLFDKLNRAGYYPVVVAETMRFQKSIQPFQKFLIETTVLGWDDKAFLLRQTFQSGSTVFAEAVVRARFLKKTGGSVKSSEILTMAGHTEASPRLEGWIADWSRANSGKLQDTL